MDVLASIKFHFNKNKYYLTKYIENLKTQKPIFKEKTEVFLKNNYHKANQNKDVLTRIVLGVIALFILIHLIYYCYSLVFFYPIDKVSQSNITNITEKAILENQYRVTSIQLVTTIAQSIGGFAILFGLYFTWENVKTAREGQITERFTRAVDQLGNQSQEIRLGGIHALGRISKESKKDNYTIMTILADYVRINSNIYNNHLENNYPNHNSISMDVLATEITTRIVLDGVISSDIQAALTIIGERKSFFNSKKDKRLNLKETFLRQADLSHLYLEGAFLSWANLEGAILAGTHLNEAYLTGTNFKSAYLAQAELKGALLGKVDFSGADLTFAHIEGANLTKAILKHAQLAWANLEKATLTEANLEGAIFYAAHLESTDLKYANLEEAKLIVAHLEGANLYRANLNRANLEDAYLEEAFLREASLKESKLFQAKLKESVFAYANLENANLRYANLEKAIFSDAILINADLMGANLEEAFLDGANLEHVNLRYANLENANLDNANLRYANLEGANLRDADLKKAILSNAILNNADLEGADLIGAIILVYDLYKVKTLRNTKIDEKLRISLEDTHSELFK